LKHAELLKKHLEKQLTFHVGCETACHSLADASTASDSTKEAFLSLADAHATMGDHCLQLREELGDTQEQAKAMRTGPGEHQAIDDMLDNTIDDSIHF
jgi:hypothetical protein